MKAPRIIFAGTPEYAYVSLSALVDDGYDVVGVLTQPDRPAGRGQQLTSSQVKDYALEKGIEVLQPFSLKNSDAEKEIAALRPDIMIVAAYGLILPQSILNIPKLGCLNIHASLLPRWRGAAPIQASIVAGDECTGVSLMQMSAGLDCGPVYSMNSLNIDENETAGELHDRLALLGSKTLLSDLPKILDGSLTSIAQDNSLATYAPKIQKKDAMLDWSIPAVELYRKIRAYNPVPGAFFYGKNETRIKVWKASIINNNVGIPGSFIQYDASGVIIACGSGALKLELLQLPGKLRTDAKTFITQIDLR